MDYQTLVAEKPQLFQNDGMAFKIITAPETITAWEKQKKAELVDEGLPANWADIGVVFDDPFIVIFRDLIEFPDGKIGSYFRLLNRAELSGAPGVVVLPEYNGKILLQYQFRHPPRVWSWEVPRGFGEPNTSAEENAKKEVLEEIEGRISNLIDLGIYFDNTGLEGNQVHLFYAKMESVGKPNVKEGIKEIRFVDIEELERMIRDAEIKDGFTIAAYTRAKLRGLI